MSDTVRVVGVDEFGGPAALKVFEVPEQHAGRGQVSVHAATVTLPTRTPATVTAPRC